MGGPRVDLSGKVFGRLTVVEKSGLRDSNGHFVYRCTCICGGVANISGKSLKNGGTKSCGCLQVESRRNASSTHGHYRNRKPTKIRSAWSSMKDRCLNRKHKDYKNYGGRGIDVCERWKNSFEAFLADVGDPPSQDHTIERICTNGNYEPGNVKWATRLEQRHNRRDKVHTHTYGDEEKTAREWSEYFGIKRKTLERKLREGKQMKEIVQWHLARGTSCAK